MPVARPGARERRGGLLPVAEVEGDLRLEPAQPPSVAAGPRSALGEPSSATASASAERPARCSASARLTWRARSSSSPPAPGDLDRLAQRLGARVALAGAHERDAQAR